MTAVPRHSPEPPTPSATPDAAPKPVLSRPVHAYLARLAALHDEAAETAHLANLLGRAPWAAAVLGTATLASVALSTASAWGAVIWLALIAGGIIAIARIYNRAIKAPFERSMLQGFARDVSASLLYLGFAWGAGLFLVLPANIGIAAAVAFTTGISIILVGVLRARDVAFCFLVPASAMGAFCALMRPLDGAFALMFAILAGGAVAAGLTYLLERISGTLAPHVGIGARTG